MKWWDGYVVILREIRLEMMLFYIRYEWFYRGKKWGKKDWNSLDILLV